MMATETAGPSSKGLFLVATSIESTVLSSSSGRSILGMADNLVAVGISVIGAVATVVAAVVADVVGVVVVVVAGAAVVVAVGIEKMGVEFVEAEKIGAACVDKVKIGAGCTTLVSGVVAGVLLNTKDGSALATVAAGPRSSNGLFLVVTASAPEPSPFGSPN